LPTYDIDQISHMVRYSLSLSHISDDGLNDMQSYHMFLSMGF